MFEFITKLLQRTDKRTKPICALCGRRIQDVAYISVRGSIILDDKLPQSPQIFTCPEQAFNYAQGFFAHSLCWMNELKRIGVELFDIDKIIDSYNKKKKR